MKLKIILSLIGFMLLYTLIIFGGWKLIKWLFECMECFIDSRFERKRHAGKRKKKKGNRKTNGKRKNLSVDAPFDMREKRLWEEILLSYIILWILMILLIIYVAIHVP